MLFARLRDCVGNNIFIKTAHFEKLWLRCKSIVPYMPIKLEA